MARRRHTTASTTAEEARPSQLNLSPSTRRGSAHKRRSVLVCASSAFLVLYSLAWLLAPGSYRPTLRCFALIAKRLGPSIPGFGSLRGGGLPNPSPAASAANHLLRTSGVLLRAPDGFTGTFLPASFVHMSMRSSNVVYREKVRRNLPTVSVLIGSKFRRRSSMQRKGANAKVVDCRAYYPSDAYSASGRKDTSLSNPLGSSCSYNQADVYINDTVPMYNVANGCSCNYRAAPGRHFARYIMQAQRSNGQEFKWNDVLCWYPGTDAGIRELIAASNSLYLDRARIPPRGRMRPYYQGWTECSASPSIEDANMMDAVVISLPHTDKPNRKSTMLSIEELENHKLQDLQQKLEHFESLNLPVLFLEEKEGMGEEECASFWEGQRCNEGYRKEFVSRTKVFQDGSCLAKAKGDDEVRFYSANSTEVNCNMEIADILNQILPNPSLALGKQPEQELPAYCGIPTQKTGTQPPRDQR
eukprot:CAMPEP_0181124868 /NCGR_PEP_ID=MMETSP1071-20121207/26728_1 /TAXON_ID=35127 /ORGANISM="Thalassiosira sp., Strain NH16" /LENGTH=471 /DNA_ID=CAMNT_0023210237 /DNA_START=93 /DNA_END=1509 /DNA_ORIENTATION=-